MKSLTIASQANQDSWEGANEDQESLRCNTSGSTVKFWELFSAFQYFDHLNGLFYTTHHFEDAVQTKEKMHAFIMELHKRVALHLMLIADDNPDYCISGKLAWIQPYIIDASNTPVPTAVLIEKIPGALRKFCDELVKKIQAIQSTADTISTAAYALAELSRIHPFMNGNGRIARILMNAVLAYKDHPVIKFKSAEKDFYHQMINEYANNPCPQTIKKISQEINQLIVEYQKTPEQANDNFKNYAMGIDLYRIFTFSSENNLSLYVNNRLAITFNKSTTKELSASTKEPFLKMFLDRLDPNAYQEAIDEFCPQESRSFRPK